MQAERQRVAAQAEERKLKLEVQERREEENLPLEERELQAEM